jgi:NAD(P)H-dependent flavin oxidoreductase YrpB (nitropropane dioxygenase family)
MVDGNVEAGIMASGQVAGLIDDLPSCAELIDRLMTEANVVLQRFTSSKDLSTERRVV